MAETNAEDIGPHLCDICGKPLQADDEAMLEFGRHPRCDHEEVERCAALLGYYLSLPDDPPL